MSWKATAYVAEIIDNITRSEKMLLLCLSNRYNDDEHCAWCSMPRLARESLMSERTAYRVIDELIHKGFIEMGERPGQTSVYLIPGLNDPAPTPDKMAGVINWRTSETPDIAMSGVPLTKPARNVTPPLTKELITSDKTDTNVADEQRTVIEPSLTVIQQDPAQSQLAEIVSNVGEDIDPPRDRLDLFALELKEHLAPSLLEELCTLEVEDVGRDICFRGRSGGALRLLMPGGKSAANAVSAQVRMCAVAAGFRGYVLLEQT